MDSSFCRHVCFGARAQVTSEKFCAFIHFKTREAAEAALVDLQGRSHLRSLKVKNAARVTTAKPRALGPTHATCRFVCRFAGGAAWHRRSTVRICGIGSVVGP